MDRIRPSNGTIVPSVRSVDDARNDPAYAGAAGPSPGTTGSRDAATHGSDHDADLNGDRNGHGAGGRNGSATVDRNGHGDADHRTLSAGRVPADR